MSEHLDEALRRQAFIHLMSLIPAGYGICPGCMQKTEVFSRRHATPGEGKERCLDCWRTER
jgi:transposase